MSAEPTWRVYLPEWMTVWTSDAHGPDGQAQCRQHFREKYRGRVRDEDWRVVLGVFAGDETQFPYCLQLFAPNLRGEFKDSDDAWELWGELKQDPAAGPHVVRRGSAEEQELIDYGRKMLPAGASGGKA